MICKGVPSLLKDFTLLYLAIPYENRIRMPNNFVFNYVQFIIAHIWLSFIRVSLSAVTLPEDTVYLSYDIL